MRHLYWLPEFPLLVLAIVLWLVGWPLYQGAQRVLDAAEWLDARRCR